MPGGGSLHDTWDSRGELPVRRDVCTEPGCSERARYDDPDTAERLCGVHFRARGLHAAAPSSSTSPPPAADVAPASPHPGPVQPHAHLNASDGTDGEPGPGGGLSPVSVPSMTATLDEVSMLEPAPSPAPAPLLPRRPSPKKRGPAACRWPGCTHHARSRGLCDRDRSRYDVLGLTTDTDVLVAAARWADRTNVERRPGPKAGPVEASATVDAASVAALRNIAIELAVLTPHAGADVALTLDQVVDVVNRVRAMREERTATQAEELQRLYQVAATNDQLRAELEQARADLALVEKQRDEARLAAAEAQRSAGGELDEARADLVAHLDVVDRAKRRAAGRAVALYVSHVEAPLVAEAVRAWRRRPDGDTAQARVRHATVGAFIAAAELYVSDLEAGDDGAAADSGAVMERLFDAALAAFGEEVEGE